MTRDDMFEPKLGNIRSQDSSTASPRFLRHVLKAMALAGGGPRAGSARFHGSRIGRGAGVGRVLAARDRYAASRTRRVIVKSRVVTLRGQGLKAAQSHLRYIQRDGVAREGLAGTLYDKTRDQADGTTFLERADGDRHQLRLIVSAEDAAEHGDLTGFVRQLMRRMEEDLGTSLDWVAVDHYNTGHPHTHIVVRGRDQQGKDLIIAREYMTHGMRERAAEIITFDLGPRSSLEPASDLRTEVDQERFTRLDQDLVRRAASDRMVNLDAGDPEAINQTYRAGRLQKLRRLGLAEERRPGQWHLADDLEPTLRRMGERTDIIQTMHREMVAHGSVHPMSDYAIYETTENQARTLVGRVLARGLSDEINDHHYLLVDGVDGCAHYVDIGHADATAPTATGTVVAIDAARAEPQQADRLVAKIAAANGGRYSVDIHLTHDRNATAALAERHVQRLVTLRRRGLGLEQDPDGTWIVPSDHLARVGRTERMQTRATPVMITLLSALPVERLDRAEGATWLDRELVANDPVPLRDAGFGREVRDALARRRQWLIEQGLAQQEGDRLVYRGDMLATLQRRELAHVADRLSHDLGLRYTEAQSGAAVAGVYRQHLDLASGRFVLIEKSHTFTLVPWSVALERTRGQPVVGIARGATVQWTLGRQRRGPSIGV